MEIIRQVETPVEWTRERLAGMYPGYTILGDAKGFFCPIEETRVVYVNYTWPELVRAVRKHLEANRLPVPADLSLEMQARFCEISKSKFCAEHDPYVTERESFMADSQRFLRAMQDAAINGLVDQAEAERRAAICAACPQNQDQRFTWCFSCSAKTAAAKLAKLTLGVSTSRDGELKHCRVCHCDLKLKPWVRREVMDEPKFRGKWENEVVKCWMRPENS